MKYLYITGFIDQLRTVAADDYVRIMVVYDKQSNGTTPAFADIVRSVAQDGTTTGSTALDHLNLDNRKRFMVLLDKRFVLPSQTLTAGVTTNPGFLDGTKSLLVQEFIKLRNLETMYKADSAPAVIGDIASGALWLITVGQQAAASEGWQFSATNRLRYIDV